MAHSHRPQTNKRHNSLKKLSIKSNKVFDPNIPLSHVWQHNKAKPNQKPQFDDTKGTYYHRQPLSLIYINANLQPNRSIQHNGLCPTLWLRAYYDHRKLFLNISIYLHTFNASSLCFTSLWSGFRDRNCDNSEATIFISATLLSPSAIYHKLFTMKSSYFSLLWFFWFRWIIYLFVIFYFTATDGSFILLTFHWS